MLIHLCIAGNNDGLATDIQTLPSNTLLPKGSNLEAILSCLLYTLQRQQHVGVPRLQNLY